MEKPKAVGILCEYNPFHTGHAHQIAWIRERQPEATVICLMSGNAVQRGETASFSKHVRAEAALRCGADLVLELPFPWCAGSANFFAAAGVCLLDALEADAICFGAECGDRSRLESIADLTASAAFAEAYRQACLAGAPAAAAWGQALEQLGGDAGALGANDRLGIEYLRAVRRSGSSLEALVLQRTGDAYGASRRGGGFPSATALREQLRRGDDGWQSGVPDATAALWQQEIAAGRGPASLKNAERAVLAAFRLRSEEQWEAGETVDGVRSHYVGMRDGSAHRLCEAARQATSLDDLYARLARRQSTTAALRRMVLFALCGVTEADLRRSPAYTLLLGANATGRSYLSALRRRCGVPVVAKAADAKNLPGAARQVLLNERLEALYALTLPVPAGAGDALREPPRIV